MKREELWITSKLWNNAHAPEAVAPALEKTLADLQLDHLDGYLAVMLAHWHPRQAAWIHGGAAAVILLIGLSRLYLRVHYPSDIAAGYAVGGLWLLLCLQALQRLRPARSAAD